MNCPYCNKQLIVDVRAAQRTTPLGWMRRPAPQVLHNATTDVLHQSAAPTIEQAALFDEFSRQRPARAASVVSDVVVPALQSLLLSLAAIPPAAIALEIGVKLLNNLMVWIEIAFRIDADWTLSLWVGSGIFCYQLYKLFGDHNNSLWDTEEGKRAAAPKSDEKAEPPKPEEVIYEVHPENGAGTIKRGRLKGVSDGELRLIAEGALDGKPLSEGEWSPLKSGKPFSASRFRQIMERLDTEGFTQLKDASAPTLGREPTAIGIWLFKSVMGLKS